MSAFRSPAVVAIVLSACRAGVSSPAEDSVAPQEQRAGAPATEGDAEAPSAGPASPAEAAEVPEPSSRAGDIAVIRGEDPPPPAEGEVPRVHARPPTVGPAYSPEVIRRVIRKATPALTRCYEGLLARLPDARGRSEFRFTIGPEGEVVSAELRLDAFEDATFEACALAAFGGLRFPKPPGGGTIVVTYPTVFVPAGEPTDADLAPPR